MIKRLTDIAEYTNFIESIRADANFSDPMLKSDEQLRCNLLASCSKSTDHVYGVFADGQIIGLFVFVVLPDEHYLEMTVGLSRQARAYDELLSYLRGNFEGYTADFVFNPANYLLRDRLRTLGCHFYPEQQKMILAHDPPPVHDNRIVLYDERYRAQYCAIHTTDCYWTAEKVIAAPDRFRIILALDGNRVVGYVDITHIFEENEPYDVFVLESHRHRGYAKAMLSRAIELNRPNAISLLVDIDNPAAVALYTSLGFEKANGENSIAAHMVL